MTIAPGDRFGRWTVIEESEDNKGKKRWLCRCDCGTQRSVLEKSLHYGESVSCGCLRRENAMKALSYELEGQRFGNLLVLHRAQKQPRTSGVSWTCLCDCGRECDVLATHLTKGKKTHCGCQNLSSGPAKDVTGQKFGRLTALYPTGESNRFGSRMWHCRCDCGTELDLSYNELAYTPRQSCGCQKREHARKLQQSITRVGGTSLNYLRSQKPPANKSTGVKGVYLIHGKYAARITFQKKTYHCGSFDTLEEAVQARKAAEELIVQGTLRHWEKWKARTDVDPVWGEQHPIEIRVEKSRKGQLSAVFLPEME